MKPCTRCGESKILDKFHKHKGTADKRFPYCKKCHNKPNQGILTPPGMKRCSRCGEVKALLRFHQRKVNRDGLAGICIECAKIQASDLKRCGECGEVKQRTEYHLNGSRCDGLAALCKDCTKAHVKASRIKKLGWLRTEGLKKCVHCKGEKVPGDFYTSRRKTKDGLMGVCKTCLLLKRSKGKLTFM